MSLARYDLRKNGGRRQKTRLAPQLRLRPLTPGELQLAGWIVYAVVLWFVMFGIDQRGIVRMTSAVIDKRSQGVTTDSPMRFERGRYLPSGEP